MRYLSLKTTKPCTPAPVWKPRTLRPTFLISFIALCLVFCIAVELLVRASWRTGGFSFGDSDLVRGEVSPAARLVFNYLPTITATGFGLLWVTATHDYMRLEPFYQMSRLGGAHAKDSLLLEYSYTFPLLVPWDAAWKQHWAVVCASTMMLLTVLLITPAMSGLFDQATVPVSQTANVRRAQPYPPSAQSEHFTTQFAYLSYNYAWLDRPLPGFTTPEYALAPFLGSANETWTGFTTLFESDLQCTSAQITPLTLPDYGLVGYNITNGNDLFYTYVNPLGGGGFAPQEIAMSESFGNGTNPAEHISNFFTPWTSFATKLDVDREAFLYLWGDRSTGYEPDGSFTYIPTNGTAWIFSEHWTAVFCEPVYYSQLVRATVQMATGVVGEVDRLAERVLYEAPGFATAAHRGLTVPYEEGGEEMEQLEDLPVEFGRMTTQYPNVESQLRRRFGVGPEQVGLGWSKSVVSLRSTVSLPAFAMYSRVNETLGELLDPEELAGMYRKAFKLLFAVGVTAEMMNMEDGVEVMVERRFSAPGFVVNAGWARAAIVGFGVVAAMAVYLLVSTWGKWLSLDGEPNSLAAAAGLLARSPALAKDLYNSEYHDPHALKMLLQNSPKLYRLALVSGEGPMVEVVEGEDDGGLLPPTPAAADSHPFMTKPSWPVSKLSGVVFFAFFGAVLVLLSFVYVYDRKNTGIPLLGSTTSFGHKILFSYLPTVIGSAVEPLLVTLGSFYCMVGPYKIMNQRRRETTLAMVLDFDQAPPHFQLWNSFRTRDTALGALTVCILLANVLAVALAGMFTITNEDFQISVDVEHFTAPAIKAGFTVPVAQEYYVLAGRVSEIAALPTWTTHEYYVLPLDPIDRDTVTSWQGRTIGFGAEISCEFLPEEIINTECFYQSTTYADCKLPNPLPSLGNFDLYSRVKVDHPCWSEETVLEASRIDYSFWRWQGATADVFRMGVSSICSESFFVGWAEHPADPQPTNQTFPFSHLPRIDTTILFCKPATIVAELTASVDDAHSVISVQDVRLIDHNVTTDGDTTLMTTFLNVIRLGVDDTEQRLDHVYQLSWFNSLMTELKPSLVRHALTNSTHLPDTTDLIATFEDIFKRVYAISLRLSAEEIFASPEPRDPAQGTATVTRQRIRVSTPMFAISVVILGYFLVLFVFLYWGPPAGHHCLSHLPTTLAAAYTLLYASTAKEECLKIRGDSTKERAEKLQEMGNTYAYGSFFGMDQRWHCGVYRRAKGEEKAGGRALVE